MRKGKWWRWWTSGSSSRRRLLERAPVVAACSAPRVGDRRVPLLARPRPRHACRRSLRRLRHAVCVCVFRGSSGLCRWPRASAPPFCSVSAASRCHVLLRRILAPLGSAGSPFSICSIQYGRCRRRMPRRGTSAAFRAFPYTCWLPVCVAIVGRLVRNNFYVLADLELAA